MGHGVDDVVDADAKAECGILLGVGGAVGPFPGIANVGVEGDSDHDAAFVVMDGAPVSAFAIVGTLRVIGDFVATTKVGGAGNLVAIIEVEEGMKNGVVVGDLDDGAIGENHAHAGYKHLPLVGAVKIVGHEKAAAEQVIAKNVRLMLSNAPLADLHGIEPGPIVNFVAIVEVDVLLNRTRVNARKTANRSRKCAIRGRAVLGPERHTFAPVAIEAAAVAIIGPGGIHETSKGPFARMLPIRRKRGGIAVFDGRILAERALGEKSGDADEGGGEEEERGEEFSERRSHGD